MYDGESLGEAAKVKSVTDTHAGPIARPVRETHHFRMSQKAGDMLTTSG